MNYKANPIGNEISCVMYGINDKILNDTNKLKNILLEALKQDNFRILSKASHKFSPQGYTIVILLAESHIALHTYPEYNSLFFYLYSCRNPKDGRKTYEFLKEKLKPSSVDFNERSIVVEYAKPTKNSKA